MGSYIDVEERVNLKSTSFWILLSLVASSVFLVWLYMRDFREFLLPSTLVVHLYSYFSIMAIPTFVLLYYTHRFDIKYESEPSRMWNYLRVSLGILWILDAALQMQPQMPFGFGHFVIASSLDSYPSGMVNILSPAAAIWTGHEILFDSFASAVQIFVGVGFLIMRSSKVVRSVALISIIWAVVIWILGEGMGGIFSPGISLITGFPGSSLVYAAASSLLFLYGNDRSATRMLAAFMFTIFTLSGIVQLVPWNGFWAPGQIALIPAGYAVSAEPVFTRNLFLVLERLFSMTVLPWNAILSALFISIGVLWATRPKKAVVPTVILSLFLWVIGQDFGVFSVYGTDPNTGIVLALVSPAFLLGAGGLAKNRHKQGKGSENQKGEYSTEKL